MSKPSNIEDIYPLSPLQQGMLFHSVYAPESGVYVEQLVYSFVGRGAVDVPLLRRAFQRLVEHHPVLRTAFAWERRDQPLQLVLRRVTVPQEERDWRAEPATARQELLRGFLREDRRQGFDLSRAPLLRVAYLRLAEEEVALVLTYHHILLDGWSVPLVLHDLFAVYRDLAAGREPRLAARPPFRLYIDWLARQDLFAAERFWRERLRGIAAATPLPAEAPAAAAGDAEGRLEAAVPTGTAAGLEGFARRHGLTLNTLLQGAWAMLLGRSAAERDVVFGATVLGRPDGLPDVEAMVGLLINTLPVRAAVPPEAPLLPWLRELQAGGFELRRYAYTPLAEIQRWSEVRRGEPLFESLLDFEVVAPESEETAFGARRLAVAERTSLPLTVDVRKAAGLSVTLSYDPRRLDPAGVHRVLRHLLCLLGSLADAEPGQALASLSLISPAERQQVLQEWNGTRRDYPRELSIPQLFELQARRTPEVVALAFEGAELTYAETDRLATRLARRLRSLGVGADVPVGVLAERSLEMVIALLAVLKAGGAYLPLDPELPRERLAFELADTGAPVLLAQGRLLARLPEHAAAVIDLDAPALDGEGDPGPLPAPHPESTAYVIYTSGSTGRPKGVMVPHRGILNRLQWMQEAYGLTAADRVLQKTPFTFDVSVWELFWPLITGARLVVARPQGHRDGAYLTGVIRDRGITVLHFVPSMLQSFLLEPDVELCRSLRLVVASGEALPADLAERLLRRLPGVALHNLYGPTEVSVDVTSWECRAGDLRSGVPIGRSIANTAVYVLDGELRPVPVGVPGEIFLGGVGVARGYLARPDLTAERFLPDPYGLPDLQPGSRLYRTGDLGRLLPGGAVDFLGRLDHQVKIRGVRIELGEVEAALARHPGVREAAAVARQDTPGETRLVAYLVADGEAPTVPALRGYLAERLPEPMIPAVFVTLDALPLTPSGKVDRRALPAPGGDRPRLERPFEPPRTPAERRIAEIWAGVLKLDRVGVHDSFFELGGDSILGLQVLARARREGLGFSLQQLLQHPTVARLARLAEPAAEEGGAAGVPPFSLLSEDDRRRLPADAEDAYPLTALQQGMLFHSEQSPERGLYHDIFGYTLRLPFQAAALRAALRRTAARHPMLRSSFDLAGFSRPLQIVHREADVPLAVEDLRGLDAGEQERALAAWIEEERGRPIDWSRPPLLRFQAHLRSEETFHFTLSFHHAVLDGWSVASLLSELLRSYSALLRGESLEIAPPAVAFRHFVALELAALESAEADGFWRRQLADLPETRLPLAAGAPLARPGSLRVEEIHVPAGTLAGLERLARVTGAPLKSVLLAAHLWVLSSFCGQADVITGLVTSGRPEEEGGERVLGLFLNTLPLRLRLASGSWRDLVAAAFAAEGELLAFRRYPLAELQRRHGGRPLFETTFNFMHFHVYESALPADLELLGRSAFEETNFPLAVNCRIAPGSSSAHLTLDCDTGVLPAPQIARLRDGFERALAAMAQDPEACYEALLPGSAAERHQALLEWNDTAAAYPRDSTVQHLIAAQARRTPEATAVICGDTRVSYRELDRLADRVARRLAAEGVRPGTLVAVCLERSAEMVAALLGVLKAGGAYVPLDPAHPAERLAMILEDARIPWLLTEGGLAGRLPAGDGRRALRLEEVLSAPGGSEAEMPSVALPEGLAYVMFTSGSTGRPKGVQVPHRALVNFLVSMLDRLGIGPADRLAAVTTLSFDIAGLELYLPLLAGATVIVVPRETAMDGGALGETLTANRATLLQATPATWRLLIEAGWRGGDGFTALCGGEALPSLLADRLAALAGPVWNLYGPTETTIWSAVAAVRPGSSSASAPLGRPIANTAIHVLSPLLLPVPSGVPGELCIGGHGLAWGYIHRPELTAERFLPDPFGGEPGGRLYRTGDLVRALSDGTLEFLGRLDHQVKVRGFRIELGEVEAAIACHPAVRQAVVVARHGEAGSRLVAYVVPRPEAELDPAGLRAHARERLPDYMVPAAWVVLAELPLTPNGKVDRRALPEPGAEAAGPVASPVAPRNPVEEIVAALWADALGRERVGIHDTFLDLGGHSLVATRILARMRRAFRLELPLRILFEAPTVAALAARLQGLLAAERSAGPPPLTPMGREDGLPLSFAQERLWFLDQLAPGGSAYNIPAFLRLEGELDAATLGAALSEIVRRHEVLRTNYPTAAGRATLRIREPRPTALPLVDLAALDGPARERTLRRLATEETRTPFDLAAAELLRARLVRLGERDHALLLTLHHIVGDGPSLAILGRELRLLYGALTAGRPSPLAALPVQYADYAAWQRGWLRDEALEAELGYWRERLAGAPAVLALPADRPWPAEQSFRGAGTPLRLPDAAFAAFRRLARDEGVTSFMLLLCAFQTLLSRWTGQTDVCVGAPVSGRSQVETEDLIGFFANTLVLRADLAGDPTVLALLARVRDGVLEAHAHQDLPFEKLVDRLVPERSLQHSPLVQVLLSYERTPEGPAGMGKTTARPFQVESGTAKLEMTLFATEDTHGLSGYLEYSVDLFDAATVQRLVSHLETLLAAAFAEPGARLSELPLLAAGERRQLTVEWNDTARRYPEAGGALFIPGLFERQAARAPEAVALTFEGERLSYREVARRANRLAHRLRGLGVGPDVPVGLCAERSFEMVVALLAILKAGGAYLPLDPDLPAERLAFMIEDAGPAVVLAPAELAGRLPAGAAVVPLDGDEGFPETSPTVPLDGANAAYVLYTSGSTGRPKGVVIPHAGILNRLLWMQEAYGLGPDDRVLQKTPYTFDVSVWEFFWPLITGARLVVARPGGHRDSAYLAGLIVAEGVTTLHFVPSMLQVFLEEPGAARCRSLARVFASGEALPAPLVERFFARMPEGVELHNLYGPTEASVDVTFWPCERGSGRRSIPIGRPIANTTAHVLDGAARPTPIGVAGELLLGGVGLARGYLSRPDLTAERFVPDPFTATPGGRLYRTGDLVRVLPDGALEFLGRIDHQVKIRGVRIELGEVEATLARHPGVREAVAVARQDTPGETRLVAYVTLAGEAAPAAGELRAFLEERLPEAMVPSLFVILERLPLNASGKVDRRALPAPAAGRPELERGYVAPRTPAEWLLAEIWAGVLGLDRVGVEDSFFHLGGDSILGIRVVARANQAGLSLAPRDLFLHRTIAELATVAAGATPASGTAEQGLVEGEVPLTPIQRWFFERELPDLHHFNQAVMFALGARLDPILLRRAVALLVAHHDALRLRFRRAETGEWRQEHGGADAPPPFTQVDLSALPEGRRAAALEGAAAALQASLDLGAGPLLRVAAFDLGAARPGRLLLAIHHLVVDGVSWRVLLEDLETAYRQAAGEAAPLPPKTTSFRRWAELLRERAGSPGIARQAGYWRETLAAPVSPLTVDFPRGHNLQASAATVAVELGAEETEVLLREVPKAYQTGTDEVLLAALALTLTGPAGGALRVDVEGHGREDLDPEVDVSRTVGWLTTLFPVVLEAGGGPGATLRSVKERLRAVPEKGIGYGLLRHLADDPALADLRRPAPSDILFNYLGQFGQAAAEGSVLRPAPEPTGPLEGRGGERHHRLAVNAVITSGRLRVTWEYSASLHRRSTVERLADGFLAALRALIDHCRGLESPQLTPSDFPLASLDDAGLDALAALLEEADIPGARP